MIRAVSGLIPVVLSGWRWGIGLIGRGDGGSRLLSFLKSVSRIIFFCEINNIRGFFWRFYSPGEEGTTGITRVLVPNNYR